MSESTSRLFLIGNGPSLTPEDLNQLVWEESWASGRIDMMYPKTDWRPTRGFWGEQIRGRTDLASLVLHLGEYYEYSIRRQVAEHITKTFIPMDFPDRRLNYYKLTEYPVDMPERVHRYDWCDNRHPSRFPEENPDEAPTSWHLEDGLCRFGSTFHIMLQQAAIEGYKEIYCLGLDLGYSHERVNYFDPDYQISHWSESIVALTNKTHIYAHGLAQAWAEDNGVKIYNATRGGALEVYPRADFDSLF